MQKRATIVDVAKQAGVNRSTVSRALRGDPRISPVTVARVSKVALQLGYVPNTTARNLALGKSETILAIVPRLGLTFPSMVLGGVEHAIFETRYHLRVETAYQHRPSLRGRDELAEALKNAIGGSADGVILITQDFPSREIEAMYERLRFPAVLVEGKSSWGGRVALDNVEAGRLATQHLISRGRRKLALVTGNMKFFRSYAERHQGFLKAIKASQVPLKAPQIFETQTSDLESMLPMAQKLLKQRSQIDGIVVSAGDPYALRLLPLLRQGGLRIPEDLAMVSFDDIETAEGAGLSSVPQPLDLFGRKAVEMLIEMIKGDHSPKLREWLAAPTLIARKTS